MIGGRAPRLGLARVPGAAARSLSSRHSGNLKTARPSPESLPSGDAWLIGLWCKLNSLESPNNSNNFSGISILKNIVLKSSKKLLQMIINYQSIYEFPTWFICFRTYTYIYINICIMHNGWNKYSFLKITYMYNDLWL